ncbi:MAG: response regulator transcription factor [Novosphingobium sp.]
MLGQNDLIREGLKRIIDGEDFDVAFCEKNIHCLLDRESYVTTAELIVVDAGNAECVETDGVQRLHSRFPDARVVILHDFFDFDFMVSAFECGVDGYIIKNIQHKPLIESLRLVALGEKIMPSALVHLLPQCGKNMHYAEPATQADRLLSSREIETLRCLSQGDPNKVIARKLEISEATVKVHVKAILRKLGLHNRTQAAAWTLNAGLDLADEHLVDAVAARPSAGGASVMAA